MQITKREFLKKHLMNWALSFTADVIRYAERDFYKGIARITSGFLKKVTKVRPNSLKISPAEVVPAARRESEDGFGKTKM